jgi:hypothetical protein
MKYVKVATRKGEGWRFCPVVRSSNGRTRADYGLVDGRRKFHKEDTYYIEWYAAGKRRRESVGRNPLDAFAAAERKEQILKNAALGIQGGWRRQAEGDDAIRSMSGVYR